MLFLQRLSTTFHDLCSLSLAERRKLCVSGDSLGGAASTNAPPSRSPLKAESLSAISASHMYHLRGSINSAALRENIGRCENRLASQQGFYWFWSGKECEATLFPAKRTLLGGVLRTAFLTVIAAVFVERNLDIRFLERSFARQAEAEVPDVEASLHPHAFIISMDREQG